MLFMEMGGVWAVLCYRHIILTNTYWIPVMHQIRHWLLRCWESAVHKTKRPFPHCTDMW